MNDIFNSKDTEYFKELVNKFPHLRHFLAQLTLRFPKKHSQTMCDASLMREPSLCTRMLFPEEINVFITPGPEYKPYILCRECLLREYQKVAGSGEYDQHVRYLPKQKKK